jgi:hypothetical protein
MMQVKTMKHRNA